MNDLKLIEQENYLKKTKLLKIFFPKFWINAYEKKNRFFDYVFKEAEQHVKKRSLSEEYLKDDHCKELWERNCDFCFEKITTDNKGEYYCSEDCYAWICPKCFNVFRDQYNWQVIEVQDIPEHGVIAVQVKIAKW